MTPEQSQAVRSELMLQEQIFDVWSTWLLRDRPGGGLVHEKRLRSDVDRDADRLIEGLALLSIAPDAPAAEITAF